MTPGGVFSEVGAFTQILGSRQTAKKFGTIGSKVLETFRRGLPRGGGAFPERWKIPKSENYLAQFQRFGKVWRGLPGAFFFQSVGRLQSFGNYLADPTFSHHGQEGKTFGNVVVQYLVMAR